MTQSWVTNDNEAEFTHNLFGEYFAALYLFENEIFKARHKKLVVGGRYNNIRFFFGFDVSQKFKMFSSRNTQESCNSGRVYRWRFKLERCYRAWCFESGLCLD